MSERPTVAAHRIVGEVVAPGDLVVDATAGNGHDTLFLARLVGPGGRVVAFDVQAAAIEATRGRLAQAGELSQVELHQESHGALRQRVAPGEASAVMFNLGYLPGGDHELITCAEESAVAVADGVASLKLGGVMTVVCYTGHPGGAEEAESVVGALRRIEEKDGVTLEIGAPAREKAPFLVVVRKR